MWGVPRRLRHRALRRRILPRAGCRHLRPQLHGEHGAVAEPADDRGGRGDTGVGEQSCGQIALRIGDCIVNP